jgi:sec-independent protein translocase protein TatB
MFDVAPTEFLLVVVVALVVIGPKDLPKAMRFVGKWAGKARGMARHFRSGLDTMMREAELEELEKQWRQQNEEIMRQYPASTPAKKKTEDGEHSPSAALPSEYQSDLDAAAQASQSAPVDNGDATIPSGPPVIETHKVPPRGNELP